MSCLIHTYSYTTFLFVRLGWIGFSPSLSGKAQSRKIGALNLSVHNGGYCVRSDGIPWKWPLEQELARKPARVPRQQYNHQVGAARSGSRPLLVLKRQFLVSAFAKSRTHALLTSGACRRPAQLKTSLRNLLQGLEHAFDF
jgi:hypothetical protein